jgi:hypothetical protein
MHTKCPLGYCIDHLYIPTTFQPAIAPRDSEFRSFSCTWFHKIVNQDGRERDANSSGIWKAWVVIVVSTTNYRESIYINEIVERTWQKQFEGNSCGSSSQKKQLDKHECNHNLMGFTTHKLSENQRNSINPHRRWMGCPLPIPTGTLLSFPEMFCYVLKICSNKFDYRPFLPTIIAIGILCKTMSYLSSL